jgi:hypothetical protein
MPQKTLRTSALSLILLLFLAACGPPVVVPTVVPAAALPTPPPPTPTTEPFFPTGLTADQVTTLQSVELVDGYPLYTMHYAGGYDRLPPPPEGASRPSTSGWACSLFAALGDPAGMVYGRNFDWEDSPALFLLTDPPDGYASVSMVDIAYLGFTGDRAGELLDLPLEERIPLLYAPFIPFDGMNETGLAVGMAAVPGSAMPRDPDRETIDSVAVIREMLDHAASVDEALAILGSYNIDWGSGPPLHYLVADRAGQAALVEFYRGERVVFSNDAPWHLATNFLRAQAGETLTGQCGRYDRIAARLAETEGWLTEAEAMELLAGVSQQGTQWSVVYAMSTGKVGVSMGRAYETVYTWGAFAGGR